MMQFDFRPIAKRLPIAFGTWRLWVAERYATTPERIILDEETGGLKISPKPLADFIVIDTALLPSFFEINNLRGSVIYYVGTQRNSYVAKVERFSEEYYNGEEAITALFLKEFEILEIRLKSEFAKHRYGQNEKMLRIRAFFDTHVPLNDSRINAIYDILF